MATFNGTNGTDLFLIQENLGQLTITLVNPYSGESIYIDEEKNINGDIYHGYDGDDVMVMTNFGDAIFIANALRQQMIFEVENFIASGGGDVIVMADEEITTGNLLMLGNQGDDILWANMGNDFVSGAEGDDRIDGGPGHDELYGDQDNDAVNGGDGDDYISCGDGNDILYCGNWTAPVVICSCFVYRILLPPQM